MQNQVIKGGLADPNFHKQVLGDGNLELSTGMKESKVTIIRIIFMMMTIVQEYDSHSLRFYN
mgnify:CR=1 FL=1